MIPVALDASMTTGNAANGLSEEAHAVTVISSTGINVGPSASLLVGMLTYGASGSSFPTNITMTWDSVAMLPGPSVTTLNGGTFSTSAIFYLINPAAGSNNLIANWTTTDDCYMSAASFTNTDVTTGIQIADSMTAVNVTSITVPSSANGATVANFACAGATPTVNFNKIWAESSGTPGGGGNYQLGGSSNVHTFTGAGGGSQAIVGVHILPFLPPPTLLNIGRLPDVPPQAVRG